MTKLRYLNHCKNLQQLKAEYKRLAKLHHSDLEGGDVAVMAAINNEYDILSQRLPAVSAEGKEYNPATREAPEEFRAAVMAEMYLTGVELELCGAWLWATGDTRPHKDALKAAGYKWSSNKAAWYWHEPGYRKLGKRRFELDEIRYMFGSEKITASARKEKQEKELLYA